MSDKMEKFIRNRRKEFDEFEPPENLWERIEKQLDTMQIAKPAQAKLIRLSNLLKIAATVVIILAAGIVFRNFRQNQQVDISRINPELARQQVHYASMIDTKRNELRGIEKADPALYKEFASEIGKMDQNYQKLKTDLATSPNQAATVNAMIRNLQTQIEVLNQQLIIIQQINQIKKRQTNETQSI